MQARDLPSVELEPLAQARSTGQGVPASSHTVLTRGGGFPGCPKIEECLDCITKHSPFTTRPHLDHACHNGDRSTWESTLRHVTMIAVVEGV